MSRSTTLSLASAAIAVAAGLGLADHATAKQDAPLASAMSQPLPAVTFDDTPLEDAIEFIRNTSGAAIYVDWAALELAGVERTTPVSVQLRGVSASKLLQLTLQTASPFEELTFYAADGVVQVTTQEKADADMVTRVYPIQDLIVAVPDFYLGDLNIGLFGGGGGGGGGGGFGNGGGGGGGLGGGGGGGGFGQGGGGLGGGGGSGLGGGGGGGGLGGGGGGFGQGGGGANGGGRGGNNASEEERANDIIELIRATIRPDVWEENGGQATIRYFRGNLVINAPRTVHALI